MLNEDQLLSIEQMKLVDRAWRGAEAYHFFVYLLLICKWKIKQKYLLINDKDNENTL